MNTSQIVRILKRAKNLKMSDGQWLLNAALPDGFKINLDTHSTATHCSIYLTMEDKPDLLIWYKTNWCSSSYEFNEQGKTIGMQSGCGFIEDKLINFVLEVEATIVGIDREQEKASQDEDLRIKTNKDALIEHYRQTYSS